MFDEKENFPGEKQIADMLSRLNRVDVPRDFDTRVRARIAREGASERLSEEARARTTNLGRIGVVAAAAVAVALGGYFIVTSINTDRDGAPAVVEVQPQPQNSLIEQPSSSIEISESSNRATAKPSDEWVAENDAPSPTNDNARRKGPNSTNADAAIDRPGGGSVDRSARVAPPKIYPRGLNPDASAPTNAKGVDPNARIHVSTILDFIGVKANWTGDGWRVDSVDAKTIAERSGIKTGDVIEAINGQTVDKQTTFPAKFDGKSLRVRRDGASLSIDFKP